MTTFFYYGCDFLYTAVRVWMGFQLAEAALEPAYGKWAERIALLLSTGGIALISTINHIAGHVLFSNNMLWVSMIVMSLASKALFCGRKRIFGYTLYLYFFFLTGLVLVDLLVLTTLYMVVGRVFGDGGGVLSISVQRSVYLVASSALVWMVGKRLCKRVRLWKDEMPYYLKRTWILAPFFLCGMIYFQQLYLQEFSHQMVDRWGIFLAATILAVSVLVFRRIKEREEARVRLLQHRVELLGDHYQALSVVQEEKAVLLHDLKNHIRVLHDMVQGGRKEEALDYLDQMGSVVRRDGGRDLVNHDIMNLVLSAKLQEASNAGIEVCYEFDDMEGLQLKSMEICTIFSNLLDNALEAVERNAKVKERWVRLSVKRKGELLIVSISNPTDGKNNRYGDGLPPTSKTDKYLHGLGLRGVRQVLEAHQGGMDIMVENQVFYVTAYLHAFTFEGKNAVDNGR